MIQKFDFLFTVLNIIVPQYIIKKACFSQKWLNSNIRALDHRAAFKIRQGKICTLPTSNKATGPTKILDFSFVFNEIQT